MPPPPLRVVRTSLVCAALLLLAGAAAPAAAQSADRPAVWRAFERAAEATGVTADLTAAVDHLAGTAARHEGVRRKLTRVMTALGEPWTVPALAKDLRDALAGPLAARGGPRYREVPGVAAAWLDLPAADPAAPELAALEEAWKQVEDSTAVKADLLQRLSALMAAAHAALKPALAKLDDAQRDLLFARHGDFCEAWYRSHFPGAQLPPEPAQVLETVGARLLLADSVDRARVHAVAAVLARLAEPAFQDSLGKRLAGTPKAGEPPSGFSGDILAAAGDAPAARVVLGGPGKSRLGGAAALVVDLGGDDVWTRAAVQDDEAALAAVALDLRGNDSWEGAGPGPVFAAGGVAIAADRFGKDSWKSGRRGQACTILGFALLADLAGDDTYAAEDFGQGYSLGGAAILHDAAGNDRYDAWACAQGSGNGPGFAALVDGDGNDRYVADGKWPDVYGDSGPGICHGASQGYTAGLRPEIPGGIAALVDLGNGQDEYQAGNFAQGGAYYFGFALMYDGGGGDKTRGCRYAQGFGVHQAAAIRWDAGGDDVSEGRSVAHAGMAWDEGVGWYLDDAGDDVYQLGGLAVGAAAQTGIAVFVDAAGADRYTTAGVADSQGGAGGSDYHQKPSAAFLLDLGGGKDAYSRPGRQDGALLGAPGCSVFWDTKEKSPDRLQPPKRK